MSDFYRQQKDYCNKISPRPHFPVVLFLLPNSLKVTSLPGFSYPWPDDSLFVLQLKLPQGLLCARPQGSVQLVEISQMEREDQRPSERLHGMKKCFPFGMRKFPEFLTENNIENPLVSRSVHCTICHLQMHVNVYNCE